MVSALLIGGSLGLGVLGYRYTAGLSWIDALLNASMILTGMGPVARLNSTGAKLFASGYALFSGVVFIASMGFVIAPIAHRLLHRFHLESEQRNRHRDEDDERKDDRPPTGARRR
jgi:hypothetical protein